MIAANDDRPEMEAANEETSAEDTPALQAVARLSPLIRQVSWFSSVGTPLDGKEIAEAEAYLSALGFPEAGVAQILDWEDAEIAARNPDWNTAWWEAEEQLRAGLIARAIEVTPEPDLLAALTRVAGQAADVVQEAAARAAARAGIVDPGLVRAAAGSATQACYQAALVLAAGEDEDHPFAIKFRLYETGRWPLGVTGSSFNLF